MKRLAAILALVAAIIAGPAVGSQTMPKIVPIDDVPVFTFEGAESLTGSSEGLDLLYAYAYVSNGGYIRIQGETVSRREEASAGLYVQLRVLDAMGNELGSGSIQSITEYVLPGERTPFQGAVELPTVDGRESGWSSGLTILASPCAFDYGQDAERSREVEMEATDLYERNGYVYYEGTATNTSDGPLTNMAVAASLYRRDGLYVGGTLSEAASTDSLDPGRFAVVSSFAYTTGDLAALADFNSASALVVFSTSTRSGFGGGQCDAAEVELPAVFVESSDDLAPVVNATPAA